MMGIAQRTMAELGLNWAVCLEGVWMVEVFCCVECSME